ncbi:MAG: lipopolysaccharide export system protein LptA [Hyphomicrobiales bacterium]|jgi:lipopolysaccharide export system protein LptA|nr:lipopolysaccharide export system protein LptA [Hyphomicrobiales bacterium]
MNGVRIVRFVLPGLLVALAASAAGAQQQPQSNMAQGLTANSGQPVKIESTSLEVRDKSRMATFTGNVKMTQGDNTVKCKVLVVYYEDSSAAPSPGTKSGPAVASPGGGKQQIKRMECKGDAIITQKDQTASGENGTFDVKANTLTMVGNVVVTQGQNVLNGDRMVIDLTTGVTKVESSGKGPVRGLVFPNAQKDPKSGPQAASPPSPPAKSSGPMRLN